MSDKYCPRCKQVLDAARFNKSASRPDGRAFCCKECMKAYRKEHHNKDIDNNRIRIRIAHYKISKEQYLFLIEKQNNKCGICGCEISSTDRNTCIDHNHETGKVRGILCSKCNSALGFLENRVLADWSEKAATYLRTA